MEGIPVWQFSSLCGIVTWLLISSMFNVTHKLRSFTQPWVSRRVASGTPIILQIQKYQNRWFDSFFSGLSCVVSVPFYTAFLPLLFWSGHGKLARQMTLLMAFCDYLGNCIKDVVSAPRPSSPPVRRVTATEDEKENALEYGLPSSHTLNTVCLSGNHVCNDGSSRSSSGTIVMTLMFWAGYCMCPNVAATPSGDKQNCEGLGSKQTTRLDQDVTTLGKAIFLLHYVLSYNQDIDFHMELVGLAMVCMFVGFIGLGRVYLGMHSVVDIIGGLAFGLAILAFWIYVHEYIDNFIISGPNVTSFSAAVTFLLLFAYPTPEFPTPSFEYHAAFSGVALGIVPSSILVDDVIDTLRSSAGIRRERFPAPCVMRFVFQVMGVQQTYHQFHHENVARIFTPQLTIPAFVGRMLLGIPTILIVKFCSKALAKWVLPIVANAVGIPIRSTSYIPALTASPAGKKSGEMKPPAAGYFQKIMIFSHQDIFDVDTGIRVLQYAGLAWSVVDLVPSLFSQLSL
ncbi:hypothetical protein LguiB_004491 [Lonicera macranthoides]